jgi:alkylation response protein AidB-like acyl-CoA dehydrogenase
VTVIDRDLMQRLEYFPSEDTQALRGAVRDWVSGNTGSSADAARTAAQRLGDEPWDPQTWRGLVGLGVGELLLPEALGGMGGGYEDFAASLEEIGRGLLATPVLGSLAFSLGALLPGLTGASAGSAGTSAGGSAGGSAELARQIADGQVVAALAVADPGGDWHGPRPVATAVGDGYTVDGAAGIVVDAPRAGVLLVFAQRSGVLGLYRVEAAAAQLTQRPALDPSQQVADVRFDGTAAQLLAEGPAAQAALDHALRLGRLATAALSIGGAESALADAVAYALARRQFGRPIAQFQAVKHLCADALLAVQQARAVLGYATWALDDGSPEAERALLAAKIAATDAYAGTAATAVQVYGAMGTTREVAVQVHFRRARFLSLLLGGNDEDRDALADQLGFSA